MSAVQVAALRSMRAPSLFARESVQMSLVEAWLAVIQLTGGITKFTIGADATVQLAADSQESAEPVAWDVGARESVRRVR